MDNGPGRGAPGAHRYARRARPRGPLEPQ